MKSVVTVLGLLSVLSAAVVFPSCKPAEEPGPVVNMFDQMRGVHCGRRKTTGNYYFVWEDQYMKPGQGRAFEFSKGMILEVSLPLAVLPKFSKPTGKVAASVLEDQTISIEIDGMNLPVTKLLASEFVDLQLKSRPLYLSEKVSIARDVKDRIAPCIQNALRGKELVVGL
ncbi:MAG: hypothetical protein EOP84_27795 [Verrucomicrobiaceae bacterium]|nr:MAG: hypothetical protein EOP84_27795 [Verrucomicrobiaceae bacterium]